MQLIKPDINIDFMGNRKKFLALSVIVVLSCVLSLVVQGLNLGIDFAGGTKLIVAFDEGSEIDRDELKTAVGALVAAKTGEEGTQVEVQDFDTGTESVEPFKRYVVYTEITSLVTQEKRTEIADLMKNKLSGIDTVDFIEDGENKFFVKYKEDGTVSAREEEIVALLGEMGYKPGSIDLESDIERQMDLQYFETRTLVEQDVAAGTASRGLAKEWEEYQTEKATALQTAVDRDFTVRIQEFKADLESELGTVFGANFKQIESSTSVSASVGKDLLNNGLVAIVYALIGILLYIGLRFDFRYSPGAVVALAHDSLITVGLFSILQVKFSQPIIAAILTIIGYSLNDTIVVFDRIRENVLKMRGRDLELVINRSLNETLSRTVLTSLTTLLVISCILILGGGLIKDFAFALLIGVLVGTYSSVFVASPVVIYMDAFFQRQETLGREEAAAAARS